MPPGQHGNGTTYQAKGRWGRNSLFVRWVDGTVRPMLGFATFSDSALVGKARAIITWISDIGQPWIAVGTHQRLYVVDGTGLPINITPVGYSEGYADASTAGGYGTYLYNYGNYGDARPDDGSLTPATVPSLDTFGQKLLACSGDDGKVYEWDVNTSVVATLISASAPTGVRAIVVTNEGFLFCLGTGTDPRVITWGDQFSLTDWTPGEPSQAGSYAIQTKGKLMAGARVKGATLVFTDTDAHRAQYLGLPLIYSFERVGSACGLVGQRAFASVSDTLVLWMSEQGFHAYNGEVQNLPCDVHDAVFQDFDTTQRSKVTAYHEPAFGEVTWFYPSASGAGENDSYVRYNYREGHWAKGAAQSTLARLAATERGGGFSLPFATDGSGNVIVLESGFSYGGFTPYAETGPIELGDGEQVMNVMNIIPDESTLGDVRRTFYAANHPTDAETTHGPFATAQPTNTRFQARQVRMKVEFIGAGDDRYGNDRLDLISGGSRR